MISSVRRQKRSISVWPGYVDVLSALLMVLIFVLLIFTVAQFLLSEILSGQDSELNALHRRVDELAELLGIEKKRSLILESENNELSGMITSLTDQRATLQSRVAEMTRQSEEDRTRIERQLLSIASLQEDIDTLREVRAELERKVGNLSAALDEKQSELGAERDRSKALSARLADEKERTLLAQEEIARSDIRIQALSALVGEQKRALAEERSLSASARAELALLSRQMENLKGQLQEIERALARAEKENSAKEVELKELGKRLNIVLAREVNQLQAYRSEFFGRLKKILGDNPDIRVEGDRFVLQAELLFQSGSADIGQEGQRRLKKIAETLKEISGKLPEEIDWILRIDGHTDKIPINNKEFSSNWSLSTARAVSVVRYLARQGIPEKRMTAAGFSKFHPMEPADTPEAYHKNRRIEIKLTSR